MAEDTVDVHDRLFPEDKIVQLVLRYMNWIPMTENEVAKEFWSKLGVSIAKRNLTVQFLLDSGMAKIRLNGEVPLIIHKDFHEFFYMVSGDLGMELW